MMIFTLAKVSPLMSFIGIVWSVIAVALIFIILIQKGKGGGLAAAFGGAGGGGLLGTKTGDFLTWVTISLVIFFLLLTVVMVKFYKDTGSEGLEGAAPTEQTMPAPETELPSTIPAVPATDTPTPAEKTE
jgi:preprotein translocase subunit SecG